MQLQFNADKEVPPEIAGWNWGAFVFTWIWGIYNNTYIALLSLFPPAHLIMMFILGAKGNEWAWRNREWDSIDEFQRVQRNWAVWSVGGGLAIIAFFIAIVGWFVSGQMPQIHAMMENFDPHRRFCNYALATAESNERCYRTLGAPLEVRGRIEAVRNREGYTELAIPVRGSKGEGTIYLRSKENANHMHRLENAEVEFNNNERIALGTEGDTERAKERNLVVVAASHANTRFADREPSGKAEAEELYRETLPRIESNQSVRQLLGTAISAQVVHANIDVEGPTGRADFNVVLRGNGTRGLLDLRGMRSMGRWRLDGAEVDLETSSGIRSVRFPAQ